MAIQFINIIYQMNIENHESHGIYLNYMVEDQQTIGIHSDLIFESDTENAIILYLVGLLRENANIINDFKFKIGIFSDFDMLVDPWVFVNDIIGIISRFDTQLAHKSKGYVTFYLELIEHIVDVEESTKEFNGLERQKYCKTLIQDFQNFAFDTYLGGSDIEFLGNYNADILNQLYLRGISLPYLRDRAKFAEFSFGMNN